MAEIHMKKGEDGAFRPDDQQSLERAAKLKVGAVYKHEVKKPRNYKFHKKYFGLLNLAFDNQEKYEDFKSFRNAVTMQAGWYNTHVSLNDVLIFSPKSISFANMDEIEFDELYNKTVNIILRYVLGCEQEELAEMVLNYV
ncbi:MAG: DUF1367 family protein [Pseudomonadales bacterium]|nr:DUF1367 family protein [Pseudomonadales bacterium]